MGGKLQSGEPTSWLSQCLKFVNFHHDHLYFIFAVIKSPNYTRELPMLQCSCKKRNPKKLKPNMCNKHAAHNSNQLLWCLCTVVLVKVEEKSMNFFATIIWVPTNTFMCVA